MADETPTTRRCIGSTRFGIEAHDAPVGDFPVQASQKDGLGRMCRTHWNEYTAGLARDAKARKAAEAGSGDEPDPEPAPFEAARSKRKPKPSAQQTLIDIAGDAA